MSTAVSLPRWDMDIIYPGLDSPEFDSDFESVIRDIAELGELFDRRHVGLQDEESGDSAPVEALEEVVTALNAVLSRVLKLGAYVHAFVTTDSRNDLAQALESRLDQHTVRLAQLDTRFAAWIGLLDVEALIESSEIARDHAFVLRRAHQQSDRLMSPAEEELAAQMYMTGGSAWAKLHGNVTSQLLVVIEENGDERQLPMSEVRNMAYSRNRDERRRGYEAEVAEWERAAVPLAAALNSIKGETDMLAHRRGWASALEVALFENNVDRQTLDAMIEATKSFFPHFRRYLRAKASVLGIETLAWYDLFAPVGEATREWDFSEGASFIIDNFGTYSTRLGEFAARAFRERWIDAEPRTGKRDGAFCMPIRGDESRLLVNYTMSYDGVSTLAHELGHAYHCLNLAKRTMLQRNTPSTLAETASIFCQTIICHAALQDAGTQEKIAIIESSIQDSCQVVVDVSSRFLFEQSVFEQRRQRELSVSELNELMLECQRQTYGDGLDPSILHPYMWAVKGHYYSVGAPFYNFPYTFGLLFGLGLYALFQQDPDSFRRGYDELLSSTGLADAATLANRFGIDLRSPDFWQASLGIVRQDIDRFVRLVED
jgi:pepF/M3 family oligoendopeptidase